VLGAAHCGGVLRVRNICAAARVKVVNEWLAIERGKMAQTWARERRGKKPVRNDPFTKADALAARRVLRDAYRARHELAKAFQSDVAATHRLRWVAVITLLRAVGHALNSVDARRSPAMKEAAKAAWTRWDQNPLHHLIFHEFIKRERDVVLKEYRFTTGRVAVGEAVKPIQTIGLSTVLLIGDRSYSALEAVGAALAWWEAEISQIEHEAGAK
jgi:hypothetical protein